MRVIPVMDLKDGVVVRGISGRRSEYRPLVSRLCATAEPLEVAESFRRNFGFGELYVADLDAIAGAPPSWALFSELRTRGFHLWVDAGVRTFEDAETVMSAGIEKVIVGLETVAGPDALARILAHWRDRLVFSLDLKDGRPQSNDAAWGTGGSEAIARRAIGLGMPRLIILDLARVGLGRGTGTEELCRRVSTACPNVELVAGGGVRTADDMKRLQECGVSAVLMASALHDRLWP